METPPTVLCAGLVKEDPAGRVASDQVVDEGEHYEEACGRSRESQTSQAFGERGHQVERQMTGMKQKYTNKTTTFKEKCFYCGEHIKWT